MGFLVVFFVPEGKNAIVGGGVKTTDYYVDMSNGWDDPALGASSQNGAWKTLHFAIDQINAKGPGIYVLHVASGEYSEVKGENNSTNIVITQPNLTIQGEGSTRPVVQGSGSWVTAFEIASEANNVTIDHLEITGFVSGRAAITVAGKDVSIRGCYIHNNSEGIHIVSGRNDTVHIFENKISDTDIGISSERSSKLIIERNSICDNNTGILTYGGTIKNNLIYDNQMKGVEAGGKPYIYHNTLDGGGIDGSVGIQLPNAKAVPTIKYNIITGFDVGIQRAKGTGTAILDYNDLWNNVTNYEGVASGRHDISEKPRYGDPANADFTLQEGSPCIDAIPLVSSYPVTEDFDNNPRPQGSGYDIGAYEEQATNALAINGCTYDLNPTSATYSSGGTGATDGSVTVTAGSGCAWRAVSNDLSWITVTSPSGGSGTDSGTVSYSVAPNSSGFPRTGSLTIADQAFTVTQKAATTTSLWSSANPSTYGDLVTFTATLSTSLSFGTVEFFDGITSLGTIGLSGGIASISTSALTGGTHSITAVYSGDGNFDPSTSSPLSQVVNKAASSIAVSSSPNPSTYGDFVTFRATLSSSLSSGTVEFFDGITFIGNGAFSDGIALMSTQALQGGTHSITAVYSGDSNFDPSTSSPLSQVVVCPTIAILPATLPSGTVGAAYSQTITASGGTAPYTFTVASGSLPAGLTFSSGGLLSGTPTTAGSSSFTVRATDSVGCFGDRLYTIVINAPVCPTITLLPAPPLPQGTVGVAYNQTITANGGTGPYTFSVTAGALPPGLTLLSSGVLSGTPITAGSYTFTVTATDALSCFGSRSYTVTVGKASSSTGVSSSANPSAYGQSVTFTATVTPSAAIGTVQFQIDGSYFGTPVTLSGGSATSGATSSLSVGNHTVTADYSGGSNYNGSTGTLSGGQTVNLAPSYTVATSPSGLHVVVDGATYGGPQTFTWVVGSTHTISAPSPQSGGAGTQYVFLSWSDGGSQGHTISAPSSSTTYTANFTTQYSLTTSVNPPEGGTVTPSGMNWYNSGQTVSVLAIPSSGYTFSSWSGDLSGSANPASLLMNGPKNVTANFSVEVVPVEPCTYSISPPSQNFGKEGGTGSVSITTGNVCQWTAWSNTSWIMMTSGGIGTGSSAVSYSVAANPGPARTGTLTIAGETFTVNQTSGCIYLISPTSTSSPSSGGTGYTISVTAGAGCAWTATSNAPWITINSGGSGIGSSAVSYSVAANTGPARTGTLTIAGETFTVNQTSGCTYLISPTGTSSPSSGGTGYTVSVTGGAGCAWTATSNAPWITINSGGSGTGNGTVSYSVAANTGPARTGTMTIAGQTVTIQQESGCTYGIDSTSAEVPSGVNTGSIGVKAGIGCTWAAASNVSWITITSGVSGVGNGTVNYSVEANTGPKRDGMLTIAGQTFTVHQAAGCDLAVNPTYASYASSGGTDTVIVTAPSSTCTWEATSNDPWITIKSVESAGGKSSGRAGKKLNVSGASYSGSGKVTYSVEANTGPARDGTMTIAGQTVTIHQESGCTYGIDSTSAEVAFGDSTGSVGVTAGNGCQWTAASNVSWISITGGASGTGNGTVTYSVAANSGPARDGTMRIAGQTFTVHQAAAIYNLTVNITGNGILRFDPPPPFPAGTKVTVYFEPADGFDILDIIVDGVSMKAVFPMWPVYTFTFRDFSENHTMDIIFG
jgi:hypothetical protein